MNLIRTAPKRGVNFDYLMWLYTRLSALAMYGLALIGIVGALIMGARLQMSLPDLMRWAFTPEVTHVQNTDVANIDAWKTLFWQVMGTLMVLMAGAHGYHGLLNVLDDYVKSAGWRIFLRYFTIAIWIAMTVVAVYVIFTS
jgi:succinate dehydrogenase hydrophobic anchor subunit